MPKGHRMSSLPIAQYCGQSPALSAKYGSGRAAAMGRAFHSQTAGEPDCGKLLAQLTPEEQDEIATWKEPADVDMDRGVVLSYSDAEKEMVVALNEDGEACHEDDEDCLTVGHLDFAWIVQVEGRRTAYVVDIKRSEWTVMEGADSLQLLTYGYAYASAHDCDEFAVGIWAAVEARWQWSDMFDTSDIIAMASLWDRIQYAATNDEVSTGAHCSGCWARTHCKEHLVPGAVGAANPAMLAVSEGTGIIDNEMALQCVMVIKSMEDLVKVAKSQVKEYARRHGGIHDESCGKVYKPIKVGGRIGFDTKKFAKDHPEMVEEYTSRGAGHYQARWVNK